MAKVLIIDDDPAMRIALQALLSADGHTVVVAGSAQEARRRLEVALPDVVLSDIRLGDGLGTELLQQLRERDPGLPVIMITGNPEMWSATEALRARAYAYLEKAFDAQEVRTTVRRAAEEREGQERRRRAEEMEAKYRSLLEERVHERTEQLQQMQQAMIFGLARLTEYRDPDTGLHLERIQEYARVLVEALARRPDLSHRLTLAYRQQLVQSCVLHDIGKCAIPDAILLRQGPLSPEEFEVMKSHTTVGRDAILAIEAKVPGLLFLTLGREIAYSHHERWDGKGYPQGLAGEAIPLSARVVALADVYDAVTVVRIYRPRAFSHEDAIKVIEAERGKLFDPRVVEAFDQVASEFDAIRKHLQPGGGTRP